MIEHAEAQAILKKAVDLVDPLLPPGLHLIFLAVWDAGGDAIGVSRLSNMSDEAALDTMRTIVERDDAGEFELIGSGRVIPGKGGN